MALRLYRRLLQSSRALFGNDQTAVISSHNEIRQHFEKNRLVTDKEQIEVMLADAAEADDMLRNSFVQAKLNDHGNYQVHLKSDMKKDMASSCPPKLEAVTPELVDQMTNNQKK